MSVDKELSEDIYYHHLTLLLQSAQYILCSPLINSSKELEYQITLKIYVLNEVALIRFEQNSISVMYFYLLNKSPDFSHLCEFSVCLLKNVLNTNMNEAIYFLWLTNFQ